MDIHYSYYKEVTKSKILLNDYKLHGIILSLICMLYVFVKQQFKPDMR